MQLHAIISRLRFWQSAVVIAIAVVSLPLVFTAQQSNAQDAADVTAKIAAPGDPAEGRALFTGRTRLANGGPPCISCHSAGNVGALGGGTLGPNLTKVWVTKSFLIDTNWLNSPDVPVMGAIFSTKRPITADEAEDLKAFFESVSAQDETAKGNKFVGGGIIGTIIMLIIFSIVWSNRYRKRNKGTAHDALWRNYGGKGGR